MPRWAKTFMILVGMIMWAAMVGVSLWLRQIPGAALLSFPAVLWAALAGRNKISADRSGGQDVAATTERESGS